LISTELQEIEAALRQLVDATRRMSRDYCQAHGLPVTTEEEMYAAMERAEDCLDVLDELQ
jgi:formiminotetrahydrofolate cyclodeaminase